MPFNCFGIQLCRSNEPCTCQQSNNLAAFLKNAACAELWLKQRTRDAMTMTGLRSVAARSLNRSVTFLDNKEIVRLVARQISSGQMRVCSTAILKQGGGDPGTTAATAAAEGVPFPISERPARPPVSTKREAPPEEATFSDDLDGSAQAAALAAAAAEGQPFCPQ